MGNILEYSIQLINPAEEPMDAADSNEPNNLGGAPLTREFIESKTGEKYILSCETDEDFISVKREIKRPYWFEYMVFDPTKYRDKISNSYSFDSTLNIEQRLVGEFTYLSAWCYRFTLHANDIFTVEIKNIHMKNGFIFKEVTWVAPENDRLMPIITNFPKKNGRFQLRLEDVLPCFYEWLFKSNNADLQVLLNIMLAKKRVPFRDFVEGF